MPLKSGVQVHWGFEGDLKPEVFKFLPLKSHQIIRK